MDKSFIFQHKINQPSRFTCVKNLRIEAVHRVNPHNSLNFLLGISSKNHNSVKEFCETIISQIKMYGSIYLRHVPEMAFLKV
jgi:hypothetical protein